MLIFLLIGFVQAKTNDEIIEDLKQVVMDNSISKLFFEEDVHGNFDFNNDESVNALDVGMLRDFKTISYNEYEIVYSKLISDIKSKIGKELVDDAYTKEYDIDRDGIINENELTKIKKVLFRSNEDGEEDEGEGKDEEEDEEINSADSCPAGCSLDNKCYVFGYRKSGNYCSDGNDFVKYNEVKESCDNNFECDSNVCIADECISKGLIRKIFDWFRRLFGMK